MPASRASTRSLRIGCSGWNYAHWRNGVFYPPRLAARNWLAFYARDERMAEELDRNLRAFAHRLPSDVSTVDRTAIVDRFLRGSHR